jgi:hypothetical protein
MLGFVRDGDFDDPAGNWQDFCDQAAEDEIRAEAEDEYRDSQSQAPVPNRPWPPEPTGLEAPSLLDTWRFMADVLDDNAGTLPEGLGRKCERLARGLRLWADHGVER